MSRKVDSPIPEFPGSIYLPDYLNLAQVAAFTEAMHEPAETRGTSAYHAQIFPVVCACIERWDIQGQPEKPTLETFRAEPLKASNALLGWVLLTVHKAVMGELEIPNA